MAELLIALSILGFGLAIIAATLPAGVRVMQQNQIRRQADSTMDSAFEALESQIVLSDRVLDLLKTMMPLRYAYDPLTSVSPFEAIDVDGDGHGDTIDGLPPSARVWPLVTWNVSYDPTAGAANQYELAPDRRPLLYLAEWLKNFKAGGANGTSGYRYWMGSDLTSAPDLENFIDAQMPAISPADRVYPPLVSRLNRRVDTYTSGNGKYDETDARFLPSGGSDEDLYHVNQMRERLLGWTAFYRPLDFATQTYEMITIVTKRPGVDYYFPVQDLSNSSPSSLGAMDLDQPQAVASGQVERRILPSPWLVAFQELPFENDTLNLLDGTVTVGSNTLAIESTGPLVFKCKPELSPLLPVGAQFFPAIHMLPGGVTHAALRLSGAQVKWVNFVASNTEGSVSNFQAYTNFQNSIYSEVKSLGGRTFWSFDGLPLTVGSGNVQTDPLWVVPDDGLYYPEGSTVGSPADYITGDGIAYFEFPVEPITDGNIYPWSTNVQLPNIGDFIELAFLNHAPTTTSELKKNATPYLHIERTSTTQVNVSLYSGPGQRGQQLPIDNGGQLQSIASPSYFTVALTSDIRNGGVIVEVDNQNVYHTNTTGKLHTFPSITGVLPTERASDSLPIFQVIERPDDETVVVRNDGLTPWVSTIISNDRPLYWPVWVIPPAFTSEVSNQPEYDTHSPIVDIRSRVVRLHPPH